MMDAYIVANCSPRRAWEQVFRARLQARASTAVFPRSLSLGLLLMEELKTQLVQHPTPANPAQLRALFESRVSQNVDW